MTKLIVTFHNFADMYNNQKQKYKQIQLYTLSMQGINTILIGQLPTFRVFRRVRTMLISVFSAFCFVALHAFGMKRLNLQYW